MNNNLSIGPSFPFRYERRHPSPLLSHYVEYYYVFEAESGELSVYSDLLIPHKHPVMIFQYGDIPDMWNQKHYWKKVPAALLHGALTVPHQFSMMPGLCNAGIFFKADGIFRLFGIPMHDMTDNIIDLRLIDRSATVRLIQELHEAGNDCERFAALERFLLRRIRHAKPEIPVMELFIDKLTKTGGKISMNELTREYKVSRQYMYRLFMDRTGLNPKMFAKLTRFQHVLGIMKNHPEFSWQEIVYKCGYYDQSHIIKDFHSFLEQTPSAYQNNSHAIADLYAGY